VEVQLRPGYGPPLYGIRFQSFSNRLSIGCQAPYASLLMAADTTWIGSQAESVSVPCAPLLQDFDAGRAEMGTWLPLFPVVGGAGSILPQAFREVRAD
jgi:hypothetical protein